MHILACLPALLSVCLPVVLGDSPPSFALPLSLPPMHQGRPYGYTPFCDSREETLGFQFWRSGYWANHLQGKVRPTCSCPHAHFVFFLSVE
jgi:hypothetical protein